MSSERFPKVNSSTSIKTRFHCFDCTDNKLLSDWAQFPSLHPFFLLLCSTRNPSPPRHYHTHLVKQRAEEKRWPPSMTHNDSQFGGKKTQKSVSMKTEMWTSAVTGELASVAWFDCTLGGRLGTGLHWECKWRTVNTSPERLCNPTASNTDEPHFLILYLI